MCQVPVMTCSEYAVFQVSVNKEIDLRAFRENIDIALSQKPEQF